jgi:hypothetical protein
MGSAIDRHKRAMEVIRAAHEGILGLLAEAEARGTCPDEIGLLGAVAASLERMLRNRFWTMVVNGAQPDEVSIADEYEAMRKAMAEWSAAHIF